MTSTLAFWQTLGQVAVMWMRAWLLSSGLILAVSSAGCGDAEPTVQSTASPSEAGNEPAVAFATSVVSFTPGEGAGFGADEMPGVVLGPPEGGGLEAGSLDVLTLGRGGEIVLAMSGPIVDRAGPDFVVFENAFRVKNTETIYQELGEIAVSADGVVWKSFPCDPSGGLVERCAGRTPVLATPSNGVSLLDRAAAGGDAFDLAEIGVSAARFVRVRDMRSGGPGPTNGFDLDAVASLHGEIR